MTLMIEITETHIGEGRRHDCRFCPAALAIANWLLSVGLSAITAEVGVGHTDFTRRDRYVTTANHSVELVNWINWFDDTGIGRPATFALLITPEQLEALREAAMA